MKRKLSVIAGLAALGAIAFAAGGCGGIRRGESEFYAYTFSDVVMTQTGVDSYAFEFSADCSGDDVAVYLTERDRIKPTDTPIQVSAVPDGGKTRFAFSRSLNLNEEYYLWVTGENKQAVLPLTVPSMFPSLDERVEGGAIFNFNYTYGVSWSSFCDPEGKAVYVSDKSSFDSSAEVVESNIAIINNECIVPESKYDAQKYYYSVTTAKNGLLTVISSPVVAGSGIKSQFVGMSASVTAGPKLKVEVKVDADGEIAAAQAEYLQLVVKSGTGDEIYGCSAEWNGGTAVMEFDCTDLIKPSLWYDICLAWRGAIITDVPKRFGGKDTVGASTVNDDGVIYSIVDWKPDGASDDEAMLKIYFEEDTARYAEEFCSAYRVSLNTQNGAALSVTLSLKENVHVPPELVLTGGSIVKLAVAEAADNGDGTYSYELPLGEALSEADKWYDIRLVFGTVYAELSKDECITNADFNKVYSVGDRNYIFREYNGLLKISYEAIQ